MSGAFESLSEGNNNTTTSVGWRIKLYELEATGNWLDKGTGYVLCKHVEELGGPALQIINEEVPSSVVFQSKVRYEDVYELQGENIIMWREYDLHGNNGIDYALSFQDTSGCHHLWASITQVRDQYTQQREYGYLSTVTSEAASSSLLSNHDGDYESMIEFGQYYSYDELNNHNSSSTAAMAAEDGYNMATTGLLSPKVLPTDFDDDNCLARIRYLLENLVSSQKESAVSQLLADDGWYFKRLFVLFNDLEDRDKREGKGSSSSSSLVVLADVMRSIIYLNEATVIELLLSSDELFYYVAGILEYDKEVRQPANYREFIFKLSSHKEVVSIAEYWGSPTAADELRLSMKHLFRLRYLRDVMMHPKIDDLGTTALNSMINFITADICTAMFRNTSYLVRVFKAIVPSLNIDDYIPTDESSSSSSSPGMIGPQPSKRNHNTLHKDDDDDDDDGTRRNRSSNMEGDDVQQPIKATGSDDDDDDAAATSSNSCSNSSSNSSNGSRPIDGMLFLRELFAMSRYLQLERRSELYNMFYAALQIPFNTLVNQLFIDDVDRNKDDDDDNDDDGGGGLITHALLSKQHVIKDNSYICDDNQDDDVIGGSKTINNNNNNNKHQGNNSSSSSSRNVVVKRFTNEEYELMLQVLGEVLSSLALVSPSLLRQGVLLGSVPSFNPLSSSRGFAANNNNLISFKSIHSPSKESPSSSSSSNNDWCSNCLFYWTIDSILNCNDIAAIQSFGDVTKLLLDMEKATDLVTKSENSNFLSSFYDNYLSWLLIPFLHDLDPTLPIPSSYYTNNGLMFPPSSKRLIPQSKSSVVASRRIIFEILIQCVQSHSYRFKYFAMRNNIINKLMIKSFMHREHAWLHLSATKFLRAVLSTKDEFYFKHIEKLDLLKGMFTTLRELNGRDNLVASSIHEIVDCIRTENIKSLILYIVHRYSDYFPVPVSCKATPLVTVYSKLRVKYEQIMDGKMIIDSESMQPVSIATTIALINSLSADHHDIRSFNGEMPSLLQGNNQSQSRSHRHESSRLKHYDDDDDEYFFSADDDDDDDDDSFRKEYYNNHKKPRIEKSSSSSSPLPSSYLSSSSLSIKRTNSLQQHQPPNDHHHHDEDDSDSVTSRNSSSGISVPLLAMLNMYGYQDDEDEDEGAVHSSSPSSLMKSEIDIISAPIKINNNLVAVSSNHNNIYQDNNYQDNNRREDTSTKGGADVFDIFAGDDFVKAKDDINDDDDRKGHHDAAYSESSSSSSVAATHPRVDVFAVMDDFDGLSSLPPLKPRFQYDDDDDDDDDSLPIFDMKMKSFSNHNHTIRSQKKREVSLKINQSNAVTTTTTTTSATTTTTSSSISSIVSPSIDKTTSHHSTTTLNDKDKDKAAIAIDDSDTERGSKSNVVVSFSLKKKQQVN